MHCMNFLLCWHTLFEKVEPIDTLTYATYGLEYVDVILMHACISIQCMSSCCNVVLKEIARTSRKGIMSITYFIVQGPRALHIKSFVASLPV